MVSVWFGRILIIICNKRDDIMRIIDHKIKRYIGFGRYIKNNDKVLIW